MSVVHFLRFCGVFDLGFGDSWGVNFRVSWSIRQVVSFGAMTAAERAEECVNEGAGVAMPEPPQEQTEEQCAAPKEVTVDSVITVDTVVSQDGKVEDTCHEEVNVKQTFTPEEPMPYGPDDGLTQEGKVPAWSTI